VGAPPETAESADRASRNAALTLAFALPGDTVLYLLLPLHAAEFGVTLFEAGVLLAANRLVRIAGYGWVASFYATRGPRSACMAAALGALLSTLGYAVFSGFWLLLAARLVWGLSFAAMNIANQALPTSVIVGAAARSGRARSIIAFGPMLGLVTGALLDSVTGPHTVFLVLALAALAAPAFAARVPAAPDHHKPGGPRFAWPSALSIWSFCMGFTLDGLFVFGLSLLAAASLPEGAVIAAGAAMTLRYVSEILLSRPGGTLAQHIGARRLLIGLSLALSGALCLLAATGMLLWIAVVTTVVLRALLQPLPAPVIADAFPGAERVPALARQATWRDIGAGTGPLAAGFLFPVASTLSIYAGAGLLLALATLLLLNRNR
jgi:MFS family permease